MSLMIREEALRSRASRLLRASFAGLRNARRSRRRSRTITTTATALAWLIAAPSAWGDVPVVYHSPADDGVPGVAPVEFPASSTFTVHLYLDGGSDPSSEIRCSTGTGDEVCFWNVSLGTSGSLLITDFTPETGLVHHLTASTLGINGGDPWRGDLGPRKIGDVVVDAAGGIGTLDVVAGEYVDSSLVLGSIAPASVVPEPAFGVTILAGLLSLGALGGRRRPTRSGARRPSPGRDLPAARCRVPVVIALVVVAVAGLASGPAVAQTSADCGDVVADGVIDAADLDAIRGFLAGDPTAPDLQGDAAALARCDVTGNGLCDAGDFARIRRYMLDMSGGMNETCPLAGTSFPAVALAPPTVDQASTLSTDRSSVRLTGSALPDELIRVEGAMGLPATATRPDGSWSIEVPLTVGALNLLELRRDFGGGQASEPAQVSVTQTSTVGDGAIEGVVFEAASNETPVAGATVSVHSVSTITDAFGRFRLESLPEGDAILRVEQAGFVPNATIVGSNTSPASPESVDSGLGVTVSLVPLAAAQTVGGAGATITTPAGYQLVVPAGSLAADTPITLTELEGAGSGSIGGRPVVDIGPEAITFDPPAILRMPYASQLSPGTPVDFVQVDQAAGTVTAVVGSTDGAGVIEVEVHATGGDYVGEQWTAFKSEKRFFEGSESGFLEVRNETVSNCRGAALASTQFSGWVDAVGFRRAPEAPFGPSQALEREEAYSELRALEGLWRPEDLQEEWGPPPSSDLVPAGTRHRLRVTYRVFEVEQPIYKLRDWDNRWDQILYGTFSYEVRTPVAIEFVSSVECPRPKGASHGDPHLIRFDHVGQALTTSRGDGRFDFQATGEFVLFESTQDEMVAQARFEALPSRPSVTVTTAAAFDVAGDRVMVDENAGVLEVRSNGSVTPLVVGVPVALPGGGELERLAPANTQDELVVRWPDTSTVSISLLSIVGSPYLNVYPDLAPPRFGQVKGLLGNANGIIGDDLNLRDGTPSDPADLYTTYSTSWRISQFESLFDYEPGEDTTTYNGVPPDPDFGLDDLDPAERAAAEGICIAAGLTEDPLLSECALDVALLGGAAAGSALDTLDQVPDVGTYVAVSGQANLFQAGQGAPIDFGGGGGPGLLPTEFPLPAGTGRVLRVLDSAGSIATSPSGTAIPADGVDFGDVLWAPWGSVSGLRSERLGQTLGVFLEGALPLEIPAGFDCGVVEGAFVAPEIGQVFCLGDGLSAASEPQTIFVPDGATRLFLGYGDRLSSQLLESAIHHLGDNFGTAGLFSLAPDPEGATFASDAFDLPTAFTPSSAHVMLDLVGTNLSNNSVWVNGQFAGNLPLSGANISAWTEDVSVAIDPSLFSGSGNVVEIRSAGGDLDDFLFKDLRVEVVPPFATLPASLTSTPFHLGDGTGSDGLFALAPVPLGLFWESPPFDAPDGELYANARIVLDVAQTDFGTNRVLLNDTFIGYLPYTPSITVWSSDVTRPFDPALLRKTGNRIRIEVNSSPFDDFMIQNVRVEVPQIDAVPPGGYSDNGGVHEFILEVSP